MSPRYRNQQTPAPLATPSGTARSDKSIGTGNGACHRAPSPATCGRWQYPLPSNAPSLLSDSLPPACSPSAVREVHHSQQPVIGLRDFNLPTWGPSVGTFPAVSPHVSGSPVAGIPVDGLAAMDLPAAGMPPVGFAGTDYSFPPWVMPAVSPPGFETADRFEYTSAVSVNYWSLPNAGYASFRLFPETGLSDTGTSSHITPTGPQTLLDAAGYAAWVFRQRNVRMEKLDVVRELQRMGACVGTAEWLMLFLAREDRFVGISQFVEAYTRLWSVGLMDRENCFEETDGIAFWRDTKRSS